MGVRPCRDTDRLHHVGVEVVTLTVATCTG